MDFKALRLYCSGIAFSALTLLERHNVHGLHAVVKNKVVPYSITSTGHGADPSFLAVNPKMTLVINPAADCRYFPPGPRLLSQPKRSPPWPVPNYTAWWQRHMGVSSLPKPLHNGAQARFTPATCKSQVWHPTNSATLSPMLCLQWLKIPKGDDTAQIWPYPLYKILLFMPTR